MKKYLIGIYKISLKVSLKDILYLVRFIIYANFVELFFIYFSSFVLAIYSTKFKLAFLL